MNIALLTPLIKLEVVFNGELSQLSWLGSPWWNYEAFNPEYQRRFERTKSLAEEKPTLALADRSLPTRPEDSM